MADEDPGDVDVFIRRPEFDSLHSEPGYLGFVEALEPATVDERRWLAPKL
jgi:hypothetical protein